MIRGLLRVAARTVAIQLEEAAAARSTVSATSGRSRDWATERSGSQSESSTAGGHASNTATTHHGARLHEDVASSPIKSKKPPVAALLNPGLSQTSMLAKEVADNSVPKLDVAIEPDLTSAERPNLTSAQSAQFPSLGNIEQQETRSRMAGSEQLLQPNNKSNDVIENLWSELRTETNEELKPMMALTQNIVIDSLIQPTVEPSVTNSAPEDILPDSAVTETPRTVNLRPSKVPNSRLGRMLHYGSLVAGMSLGAASEAVRRSTGSGGTGSLFMSEANVRRLVDKLGRMRGAALKLGQFMSIQDTNMLPEQLENILQQVQANAHYMPDWQLEDVMRAELGEHWADSFSEFERIPMASASIGQVHGAKIAASGLPVAVKVQFPGIASSITSDLDNLSLLLKTSALLPRGLYLDNTLAVMRRELADECDYVKEAASGRRFRELLKDDPLFEVPEVIDDLTSAKVLTTQMMSGRPLSEIKHLDQMTRDKIGEAVLRLCLKELFVFRFMQTDPNWANFLYDKSRGKLQLIDFGASREYTVEFMDNWYRLLTAALTTDRDEMVKQSLRLRYLTGDEKEEMIEAHIQSMSLLATPFITPGVYDFGRQSVTDEVRKLIPTMLRHRLTPPPNETYSLNRKLGGCFLLCAKLGARVDCQRLWQEVVGDYKVSTE